MGNRRTVLPADSATGGRGEEMIRAVRACDAGGIGVEIELLCSDLPKQIKAKSFVCFVLFVVNTISRSRKYANVVIEKTTKSAKGTKESRVGAESECLIST